MSALGQEGIEAPNVINGVCDATASYTTTNLAEAMPGVASPLGWSVWGEAADVSGRTPWGRMGAIPMSEVKLPDDPSQRVVNIFYGRAASRMNFFCEMGDLIPGSTGENLARDAFGFVPPGFQPNPTKRRYPVVFVKMPKEFLKVPHRVAKGRAETEAWYREVIPRTPQLDLRGAGAQLAEARERFTRNLCNQSTLIICGIQPVFTKLMKLVTEAQVDPTNLMRGHGKHEETAMIDDLWRLSRDEITFDEFLLRHGYHGPNVGEVSQRSWREDPTPLHALVDGYRAKGAEADPFQAAAERGRQREAAEQELLAKLPRSKRPGAKYVLKQAGRYLPLRAVSKIAFTQAIDVARASARRAGALLAEAGAIADPEDVFYLTVEEIQGPLPADVQGVIAERKELRDRYWQLDLPVTWTGLPTPVVIEDTDPGLVDSLSGVGVSGGVVEGLVRVVDDPAETDMDDGEILVTHTTDPSWASVMFLASALVVDIGGQLSHAAVVAREIGVPCVMNTEIGTRTLRTGDRVRVDGGAGTVEVLERAPAPA